MSAPDTPAEGGEPVPVEVGVEERPKARGYSWPPFEKGHELSMRHGAYSPRRVEPLAGEMVERVIGQASVEGSPVGYLLDVTYRPALWAWARAEARVQLLEEWLQDRGSVGVDAEGEELGAARALHRAETLAAKARQSLGLDPLARARLGKDVAATGRDRAELERLLRELEA